MTTSQGTSVFPLTQGRHEPLSPEQGSKKEGVAVQLEWCAFDYRVKAINRLDPRALEVILAPTARPLPFVAGQFVFVHFGGSDEWERHPFSVSSAPQERDLRAAIEALGDYTQHLSDTLPPGAPAIVSIAFGLFDYRQRTREKESRMAFWLGKL